MRKSTILPTNRLKMEINGIRDVTSRIYRETRPTEYHHRKCRYIGIYSLLVNIIESENVMLYHRCH